MLKAVTVMLPVGRMRRQTQRHPCSHPKSQRAQAQDREHGDRRDGADGRGGGEDALNDGQS